MQWGQVMVGRAVVVASLMLWLPVAADHTSSKGPSPRSPILMGCPGDGMKEIRLTHPVAVDGFIVEVRGRAGGFQASTTVTVAAGRFQRVLRAKDSHVLKFRPALVAESFRVSLDHEMGSACVARITLLAGDTVVTVVEP